MSGYSYQEALLFESQIGREIYIGFDFGLLINRHFLTTGILVSDSRQSGRNSYSK